MEQDVKDGIYEDTPLRLLIGTDAVHFAERMMESRLEEYVKWKEFSCQSDFETQNGKE